MKKKFISILVLFGFVTNNIAQVPNQFNYQAVARNNFGQAIANANIKTKFTILDGSTTGTNVYSEVRSLTTNQLGLFTAAIGGSGATNVTGNFATIDWSTGKKFIKVELDPLGGNNFIALGNTEMLSVPYALYAVNGKVGPVGPPNVLTIGTVTTGNTGSPASATITGTSPAQTINLVLPTGANGKISLVKTSTEIAGANCTVGGTKIEAGVDINSNSTLDASEVTNISYVCNGDVNNTWKLNGNAGTTANDFIGTTSNKPFIVKTNNAERMRIDSVGNVSIGTATSANKLFVTGSEAAPMVQFQNNNASPQSYGLFSFSENSVGVFAQSLNGRALVGFTNSTTQPAAEFTNNVGAGVTITNNATNKPALDVKNNGSNLLSNGINSFSQGGVGVLGQSNTGNGIAGLNNSVTQPTAKFTNANTNGAAINVQGGIYSPSTLGNLNMVPIGVIQYWVSRGVTAGGNTGNFRNIAGNLGESMGFWAEVNFLFSSGIGVELRLNPLIVNQYSKLIAINSPSFQGTNAANEPNTEMNGIHTHFNPGRRVNDDYVQPDEQVTPTNYLKLTIEAVIDFPITASTLSGTVIIYGVK